ncbi:MAG: HAMP domain-containing sensor histidine kinase [Anaeromyxobacter sp.]
MLPAPNAPAGDPAPDLQLVTGYEELRWRYLRAGVLISAAVNAVGVLDLSASAAVQAVRVALLSFCLASAWRLRRPGAFLRGGRVVPTVLTAGLLVIVLLRLDEGWPVNLGFLPALVAFSTLVASARVAMGLIALCLGSVGAALLLGLAPPPAHLSAQALHWVLSLVLLNVFLRWLAALLARGASQLAASAEALAGAQLAVAEVSEALSGRVSAALAALREALQGGADQALPSARRLAEVLAETRRAVPPEPELDSHPLALELRALRLRAQDWAFALLPLFLVLTTARAVLHGPRDLMPYSAAALALSIGLGLARWLRPRWAPRLALALWLGTYALMLVATWGWLARAPIPPPPLVSALTGTLLLGVMFGPWLAWGIMALVMATCLLGLRLHPGMPWTAPVNLTLAYGLMAWAMWRWPRELLARLRARRDAAAAHIRQRRRLVATLFHDLANPLMVIQDALERTAAGDPPAEGAEVAQAMVARMEQTLAAAVEGRVAPRALQAGRLCDGLELLFRQRLRAKQLSLRIAGPREARLLGDEALLRDSVLANLASNALKFSPPGAGLELTIRTEGREVALELADRGPGLPREVLAAWARGRAAPSRPGTAGEEGSGYGLLLAREYVAAMGGRLELRPRDGGGLRARVVLPAAPPEPMVEAQHAG